MSHYTKEDIIRIVEEEDVEFIRSAICGYFWNFEKHGSNSQTVGFYFE